MGALEPDGSFSPNRHACFLTAPWHSSLSLPQATGVAGVATNKGGVAIGVRVWDTDLCFINSHLAAHQDKLRARNNNYRDIVRGIRIDPYNMDCLTAYHHVFWMGDLNYRLDWGQQASNPTETPTQADFDEIVRMVEGGKYEELLQVDQLKKEMEANRAFLGGCRAFSTAPRLPVTSPGPTHSSLPCIIRPAISPPLQASRRQKSRLLLRSRFGASLAWST